MIQSCKAAICAAVTLEKSVPFGNHRRIRRLAFSLEPHPPLDVDSYAKRFPKAVQCLEEGLEDSLAFYAFPMLDVRKISSSNMIERLNREIRRHTSVVGIFPNESSYVRLVTAYLMEYAEDWSVSRAYISHESIAATLTTAA
ncbi:hypothetical protein DWV55_06365 [Butyricicoccus sp. AF10-3]|nr:hypothetical protein DWV55_06365 [Butyricicoccus sp. AF10-3]